MIKVLYSQYHTSVWAGDLSSREGEKFEDRNNSWFIVLIFILFSTSFLEILLWWFNGGVTPVLIPNTEVKLASGDGTHGTTWGE